MKPVFAVLTAFFLALISCGPAAFSAPAVDDASVKTSQTSVRNSEPEKKQPFNWANLWSKNVKNVPSKQTKAASTLPAKKKTEPELNKNNKAKSSKGPELVIGKASAPAVNVEEVNRQLQDILKVNDTLRIDQIAKAAQIQQIQEQSKIHQQLLKRLETTDAAVNRSEVGEVLRQEKIRIIREQTNRNTEIVKTLQRRS